MIALIIVLVILTYYGVYSFLRWIVGVYAFDHMSLRDIEKIHQETGLNYYEINCRLLSVSGVVFVQQYHIICKTFRQDSEYMYMIDGKNIVRKKIRLDHIISMIHCGIGEVSL